MTNLNLIHVIIFLGTKRANNRYLKKKKTFTKIFFLEREEEEDSPFEEFLETLLEILDPNGPIATPVATVGVLGKSYFATTRAHFLF